MVQRRCTHVPAPCMETRAAPPHQKADPHVPAVRGMEIGVAGAGAPCLQVLGGSRDQREPRRGIGSILSWTRVMDAGRGTRLPPLQDQTPLCVRCPDAVPGWVSPDQGTSGCCSGRFCSTAREARGDGGEVTAPSSRQGWSPGLGAQMGQDEGPHSPPFLLLSPITSPPAPAPRTQIIA